MKKIFFAFLIFNLLNIVFSAKKNTEKENLFFKEIWQNENLKLTIKQYVYEKEKKEKILITHFNFFIKKGFHINTTETKYLNFIPTRANLIGDDIVNLWTNASEPKEKIYFNKKIKVYEEGAHSISIFSAFPKENIKQNFTFNYQACTKRICYPPTKISFFRKLKEKELAIANNSFSLPALQTSSKNKIGNVLFYFLFAFLGGIVLNFMPCVLPAVSLKILSLIKVIQETKEKNKIKKIAGSYFLGIFSLFFLLATTIVLLHEKSWGFQFQYPSYLTAMAIICWFLGLEISEIFTFSHHLPRFFFSANNKKSKKENYLTHFFSGGFFVLLSTPCIAPFLGIAITYAFHQSLEEIYLIFLGISMGFSLPFLLLIFGISSKKIQKYLPKPGLWMEKLKSWLALPMFGMALWLFFLLFDSVSILNNAEGKIFFIENRWIAPILVAILSISIVAPSIYRHRKKIAKLNKTFLIAVGILLGYFLIVTERESGKVLLDWQKFDEKKIEKINERKNITLVHISAKWCITCAVNEFNVLETKKTKELFEKYGVVLLYGDLTTTNVPVNRYMKRLGFVGIPLDIIYPKENNRKPIVLPTIFTFNEIKQAIIDAK